MKDLKLSISKQDIIGQVNRICDNVEFKSKALLCGFLRFVVEETLAGRGNHLKGYTIGVEVLGKDKDFDPEQDSLVRIHAGRLRRLLKLYYLEDGKDDPVRIDIPKGSYQPQFHSGYREEMNHEEFSVIDKDKEESLPLEPTVAVLPFKNLTGDPEKEFFAHGFSEELSIELTKYANLKVINCWHRPESDTFNNINLLHKYGARFLIDGGVLIHDQHIKILVKLMGAATGKQIWAEGYLRDLSVENLIEIEEDISESIAKTIGSEIGIIFQHLTEESNRVKPDKLDVFNAVLSFYYYEARHSQELMVKTFEILQKALAKDPNSGIIHAMLATLYGNAYALDFPNNDGAYEKMGDLAEKAVELDPNHQLVRILYTYKCFIYNDRERFLKSVNHCLAMNLNSPARLGSLGFHRSLFGDWELGKRLLDKAMNKNTGYPLFFHGATSLYHYRKHEYEKALDEAIKYDIPGLFWGPMLRIACLGKLNKKKEASLNIEELLNLKPDFIQKANYLISRFVKEKDLVIKIMDGLSEAGLHFPANE